MPGPFDIAGEDMGGKPVLRVVGDRDRFLLILKGMIASTGPNISSRAMVMSLLTSAKMVGRT